METPLFTQLSETLEHIQSAIPEVVEGYLSGALWLADPEPGSGEYHPDLGRVPAAVEARVTLDLTERLVEIALGAVIEVAPGVVTPQWYRVVQDVVFGLDLKERGRWAPDDTTVDDRADLLSTLRGVTTLLHAPTWAVEGVAARIAESDARPSTRVDSPLDRETRGLLVRAFNWANRGAWSLSDLLSDVDAARQLGTDLYLTRGGHGVGVTDRAGHRALRAALDRTFAPLGNDDALDAEMVALFSETDADD